MTSFSHSQIVRQLETCSMMTATKRLKMTQYTI